jgi:hypothetical protein
MPRLVVAVNRCLPSCRAPAPCVLPARSTCFSLLCRIGLGKWTHGISLCTQPPTTLPFPSNRNRHIYSASSRAIITLAVANWSCVSSTDTYTLDTPRARSVASPSAPTSCVHCQQQSVRPAYACAMFVQRIRTKYCDSSSTDVCRNGSCAQSLTGKLQAGGVGVGR